MYIFIFIKIGALRKNSGVGLKKSLSDIKLLIPALFEIVLTLLLEVLWEYWLEPNAVETHKYIILNYLFIIVSGTNTLSGILIIKEVKVTAGRIWNYRKKTKIRMISVAISKK